MERSGKIKFFVSCKRVGRVLVDRQRVGIYERLPAILGLPGMEGLLDAWRDTPRQTGTYKDIFDGKVAQEVLGADGLPFFRNASSDKSGPNGELRIGVTLGVDWSVLRDVVT